MNMMRFLALTITCWFLHGCVSAGPGARQTSEEDAAQANLNLGAAYLRQGRPELALDKLERALEQNPRLANAHSTIALVYDQLGEPGEAEVHYRRAVQLEPGNAAAANSYAVFLCRNDRWVDAERYFNRAAENPRYTTPEAALTNAGLCARNAGDEAKAEEYFRAALAKAPTFDDALYHMTDLAYQRENYLQARAFMQRYFDSAVPNPPMLWLCIRIEQELDNFDDAQRCATQLRDRFPESEEVAQLHLLETNAR